MPNLLERKVEINPSPTLTEHSYEQAKSPSGGKRKKHFDSYPTDWNVVILPVCLMIFWIVQLINNEIIFKALVETVTTFFMRDVIKQSFQVIFYLD